MNRITLQSPGQFTTVQDLGRIGHGSLGVAMCGAADQCSLRLGNRLVGNPDSAAALEMTFVGATVRFDAPTRVALTGARAPRASVPMWRAVDLESHRELAIGPIESGVRTYLCIAGGIDTPQVLGSRAAHVATGLGPPRCAANTTLPVGSPTNIQQEVSDAALLHELVAELDRQELRIVPGPHRDHLPQHSWDELLAGSWCIDMQSDRIGTRLIGPSGASSSGALPTEGAFHGAIQLPPSGQPIILGPDCAPTGGYPIIASIASVDLPALAQRRPGETIRFTPTSIEEAQRLARARKDLMNRAIAPIQEP
ncbi:MAG: biotin-dependent carboxyltransferase [Phycisphaerales bacterium]|nr:biotin-dependent carboxyltransferase [Phycisphaerales bacterium]